MLKRLQKGDWIVFYSPKTSYEGGEPLQSFTALGWVTDDELYQVELSSDFVPWRRNITFQKAHEVFIKPFIDDLGFITQKTHWGYMFRFGMFEIPQADFELIRASMM